MPCLFWLPQILAALNLLCLWLQVACVQIAIQAHVAIYWLAAIATDLGNTSRWIATEVASPFAFIAALPFLFACVACLTALLRLRIINPLSAPAGPNPRIGPLFH